MITDFTPKEQQTAENVLIFCMFVVAPLAYVQFDLSVYDSLLVASQTFGAWAALKLIVKSLSA